MILSLSSNSGSPRRVCLSSLSDASMSRVSFRTVSFRGTPTLLRRMIAGFDLDQLRLLCNGRERFCLLGYFNNPSQTLDILINNYHNTLTEEEIVGFKLTFAMSPETNLKYNQQRSVNIDDKLPLGDIIISKVPTKQKEIKL